VPITMKLIDPPAWAPAYARHVISVDGEAGARAREVGETLRAAIAAELDRRVNEFANDPEQCFLEGASGFPLRDHLAGTYYIGSERYEAAGGPGDFPHRLWIEVRCLEIPRHPNQESSGCDYLALEAIVDLSDDGTRFRFDEGFNTSVI
jgi:hypothetical protein